MIEWMYGFALKERKTRRVAVAKKADRTAYDIQHSRRTEPFIYNCTIMSSYLSILLRVAIFYIACAS